LVEHVINDAVPLTLLPVVGRLGRAEDELARRLLQDSSAVIGPPHLRQ
jgi:hypothetical protein